MAQSSGSQPSTLGGAVSNPVESLSERELAKLLTPGLRALADETRLTLILLIAQHPRTVKELQQATGLSQTLVSHHLVPLREQQLVQVVPRGRSNVYTLCRLALAEWVKTFLSIAAFGPEAIAAHLQPATGAGQGAVPRIDASAHPMGRPRG
jgi:DNA-binding transcriptional ArsR family regulator